MMTKPDIMSNSLDQLIERFGTNPESFEYLEDQNGATIMWQTKLNVNDKLVADPTSYQRTVLVVWSELEKSLSLCVFNCTFSSIAATICVESNAKLAIRRPLEKFRPQYRKFYKLIKLTKKHREHAKTKEFITKMSTVFPSILDHFILGK